MTSPNEKRKTPSNENLFVSLHKYIRKAFRIEVVHKNTGVQADALGETKRQTKRPFRIPNEKTFSDRSERSYPCHP